MKLQHDKELESCIGLTPKWILGSNVLIQRSLTGVTIVTGSWSWSFQICHKVWSTAMSHLDHVTVQTLERSLEDVAGTSLWCENWPRPCQPYTRWSTWLVGPHALPRAFVVSQGKAVSKMQRTGTPWGLRQQNHWNVRLVSHVSLGETAVGPKGKAFASHHQGAPAG